MTLFNSGRKRLRRQLHLAWDLEEARQDFLWGRNMEAYLRLMHIMEEVIDEPPLDSEEYRDGERKSATPDDEQEEIEEGEGNAEEVAEQEARYDSGPQPERDEDGYIIR